MTRKGGTGGGGWSHRRVTGTWWLLGLALKGPWLVPGGPPPALTAWTGLEKHCSHLVEGWFLARKAAWALSGCMATDRERFSNLDAIFTEIRIFPCYRN